MNSPETSSSNSSPIDQATASRLIDALNSNTEIHEKVMESNSELSKMVAELSESIDDLNGNIEEIGSVISNLGTNLGSE